MVGGGAIHTPSPTAPPIEVLPLEDRLLIIAWTPQTMQAAIADLRKEAAGLTRESVPLHKAEEPRRFVIVTPCYNEEAVIKRFLTELEDVLATTSHEYTVVIVDDCSTDGTQMKLKESLFKAPSHRLRPIRLTFNCGHQGAIRQGLRYAERFVADGYIVMDSDGEDDPAAIGRLTEKTGHDIVFVKRGKRSESLLFKAFYALYKALFRIISGNRIYFGNFSMISRRVLVSINRQEFVHYPAFLSKTRFPKTHIRVDRRKRIDGDSKMNFDSLVMHGLMSLIEYSEQLLFFFIRILLLMLVFLVAVVGYVAYERLIMQRAIVGWTSTMATNLLNGVLITTGIIVLGLLIVSQRRISSSRDDLFTEYPVWRERESGL
jgi:glycosyltransferase involved in cell wall biosynthesis